MTPPWQYDSDNVSCTGSACSTPSLPPPSGVKWDSTSRCLPGTSGSTLHLQVSDLMGRLGLRPGRTHPCVTTTNAATPRRTLPRRSDDVRSHHHGTGMVARHAGFLLEGTAGTQLHVGQVRQQRARGGEPTSRRIRCLPATAATPFREAWCIFILACHRRRQSALMVALHGGTCRTSYLSRLWRRDGEGLLRRRRVRVMLVRDVVLDSGSRAALSG